MVAVPRGGATTFTARPVGDPTVTVEPLISASVPAPVYDAVLVITPAPAKVTCA